MTSKRHTSADINRPLSVTVTGGGGAVAGGGSGTLPGTLTGDTGNTVVGDRHYHKVQLAHSALLGIAADDHHDPVTVGNTGLSIAGQQVSLNLAAVSGLEVDGGLKLADSIAGAGLSIASKVLSIALATNSGLQLSGAPAKLLLRTPSTIDAFTANTVTDALGHTHAVTAYSDLTTYPGHLAKADTSGDSTWHKITLTDRLRTSLIDSAKGTSLAIAPKQDINLSPGGTARVRATSGVRLQADNYVSQTTGWAIGYNGAADFRYVYTDELHAKAFIADLEQALAGGQIISKSVAPLSRDFTAPAAGGTADIWVECFQGFPSAEVFAAGDVVMVRNFDRAGGGLDIANCFGTVSEPYIPSPQSDPPEQCWTFTRLSGTVNGHPAAGYMTAGQVVKRGALALDFGVSGNGYHEVNAIDGLMGENSPYDQNVKWDTHPWYDRLVVTRQGNLKGIFNVAGEYGLYAGTGVTDADKFLRISNQAIEGHNLPIKLYDGADVTISLTPGTNPYMALGKPIPTGWLSESGFWTGRHTDGSYRAYLGTVSGGTLAQGWQWDGSTLTVRGTIVVQAGSSGISNLSDAGALATKNSVDLATGDVTNKNLDNVADGSTYKRVTANEKTGAGRGYAGLDSNAYVSRVIRGAAIAGGSAATGLNLTADYLGYYDGTAFRTYLDKNGNFLFSRPGGASLLWSASAGKLQGRDASSNVQWETDATTGAIVAGAGQTRLDATGLNLATSEGTLWDFDLGTGIQWKDSTHTTAAVFSEVNSATHRTGLRLISGDKNTGAYGYISISADLPSSPPSLPQASHVTLHASWIHLDGTVDTLTVGSSLVPRDINLAGGLNVGTATGAGTGDIKASGGISGTNGTFTGGLNLGTATGAGKGEIKASGDITLGADNYSSYNLIFVNKYRTWNTGQAGYDYVIQDTTDGEDWLRIDGNGNWMALAGAGAGNVLIGTTSDNGSDRLQVAGGIRASLPVVTDNRFILKDGITAPNTISGFAQIYVDSADGDLKVKFGDGTVKTIVTD